MEFIYDPYPKKNIFYIPLQWLRSIEGFILFPPEIIWRRVGS